MHTGLLVEGTKLVSMHSSDMSSSAAHATLCTSTTTPGNIRSLSNLVLHAKMELAQQTTLDHVGWTALGAQNKIFLRVLALGGGS